MTGGLLCSDGREVAVETSVLVQGHRNAKLHSTQRVQSLSKMNPLIRLIMSEPAFIQSGPIKNMALYFCLYLCHLLTDFQNSSTGTLCRQFAIMWLLCIPPHCKCVFTLPCEI